MAGAVAIHSHATSFFSASAGASLRRTPRARSHRRAGRASLQRLQKYVVSRTLGDPGWENSTVLAGEPVVEVRRLKDAGDGDLVVTGSITLTHVALEAGPVDELRLFVHPAIQGRGRGLVDESISIYGLTPLESRSFGGGVTLLRCAVG